MIIILGSSLLMINETIAFKALFYNVLIAIQNNIRVNYFANPETMLSAHVSAHYAIHLGKQHKIISLTHSISNTNILLHTPSFNIKSV